MSDNNTKDDLTAYFHKHSAPLLIQFVKGNEEHHYTFSNFIISIEDDWFFITAGHCLRAIDQIKEEGYVIKRARLIDFFGLDAKYENAIPFDYDNTFHTFIDKQGFDYGIIPIPKYYRPLLESNNIKALNEETWEKQPNEPDFYFLMGIPHQLTVISKDNIKIAAVFPPVLKCDSIPDGFEKTDAPTFYGKIYLDDSITDIDGMSGGPIFSFKRSKTGELKYWLCAVQSRWIPSKSLIAGCLVTPFVSLVRDVMYNSQNKNP